MLLYLWWFDVNTPPPISTPVGEMLEGFKGMALLECMWPWRRRVTRGSFELSKAHAKPSVSPPQDPNLLPTDQDVKFSATSPDHV